MKPPPMVLGLAMALLFSATGLAQNADRNSHKSAGSPEPIESFRTTWKILDQLPEELKDKFGRGNALAIYRF